MAALNSLKRGPRQPVYKAVKVICDENLRSDAGTIFYPLIKAMGSERSWIREEPMSILKSRTGEIELSRPTETLMNIPRAQMLDTELQSLVFVVVSTLFSLIFHCFLPYLPFGIRKFTVVIVYSKYAIYSLVYSQEIALNV